MKVYEKPLIGLFGENDTLLQPTRFTVGSRVLLYAAYCIHSPNSSKALKEVQRTLEVYARGGMKDPTPEFDCDDSLRYYHRLRRFLVEGITRKNVNDLLKKIYTYFSMTTPITERDLVITAAVVAVGCRHKSLLTKLFTAIASRRGQYVYKDVVTAADMFVGIVRKLHCTSHHSRTTKYLALYKYAAAFQLLFINDAITNAVK